MPISDLPTKPGEENISCDLLIVGSGPIGMAYARQGVLAGMDVRMVECGSQESSQPAYHKKNEVTYQKDINRFVNVIKSALETVSVPVDDRFVATLDPASWSSDKPVIQSGQNPNQKAANNLGAQAVTRGIGGMSTHWTCAIPHFHPEELPDLFDNNESVWSQLYKEAEELIGLNKEDSDSDPFKNSIRQYVVQNTLNYELAEPGQKVFKRLPLACSKQASGTNYINWHSAYQLYDGIKDKQNFRLYKNALCTKLERDEGSSDIKRAIIDNLMLNDTTDTRDKLVKQVTVTAKYFVIAAGAVLGPQLLVNSGLSHYAGDKDTKPVIPNLGENITEQPMAFCQIVLRFDIIDSLDPRGKAEADQFKYPKAPGWPTGKWPEWIQQKVRAHIDKFPNDPLPIPFDDKEPQVTKPYSPDHRWHTQIHRDAFSYGEIAASIDTRLVVDLRFFGKAEPRKENTLFFEKDIRDGFGMPQATFNYNLRSEADDTARTRNHQMMKDMTNVAAHLGGYLPGSEPQFMEPGLALHLGGTMRAGKTKDNSVVNADLQVWTVPNLYLAGNGVIPTAFAANPTLTSLALANRSAKIIVDQFQA